MQTYYCYNKIGKVIGMVMAISGDEAWSMARAVQPEVAYLRPSWLSGPFGQPV
jgi:hypothetical protein